MKTMKLNKTQRQVILNKGKITLEMRESYFPRMDIKSIRQCLAENGINAHLLIEAEMTDVAIVCKGSKLYMKVCSERDARKEQIGLWSGPIIAGIEPSESAMNNVFVQTGIWLPPKFLEMRGTREYKNTYDNGEEIYVMSKCYVMRVDCFPDFSSVDYRLLGKKSPLDNVVEGQREFVSVLQKSLI